MEHMIRSEFPRPDFARSDWQSLNGAWDFAFGEEGSAADFCQGKNYTRKIWVPFCYQCPESGIGTAEYHETVWYSRSFRVTPEQKAGSILLKFGAVDYECRVWLNGAFIGSHQGGYTQFCFDIAQYAAVGENILCVMAKDDRSCDRPRGKQYWKDVPDRCWYTESTGIWKSVWLEFTGKTYIENFRCIPDLTLRGIRLDARMNRAFTGWMDVDIFWQGQPCRTVSFRLRNCRNLQEIITLPEADYVDEIHFWSPENPVLYTMTLSLRDENLCDRVDTCFGMREVSVKDDRIYLNRKPLYQRLILNQGYWPESLTTPPSEEAIIRDLTAIKAMGFNGVRMHQKNEDPLFYHHADRLGLVVWLELPSGYQFNPEEVHNTLSEWGEMVRENWNHPSIIAYVPFNESWGVRDITVSPMQQSLVSAAYYLTKALDPTRLVSSNDGWELSKDTDFYGVHSYFGNVEAFCHQFMDWEKRYRIGMVGRPLQIGDVPLARKPVLLTEFGGVAFTSDLSGDAWGYNEGAASAEDYARLLREQVEAVLDTPHFCGYCYTQLTDVMQEVNGLLWPDRTPKLPKEQYRAIFGILPEDYRR